VVFRRSVLPATVCLLFFINKNFNCHLYADFAEVTDAYSTDHDE